MMLHSAFSLRIKNRLILAVAFAISGLLGPQLGYAATITVSSTVIGKTPQALGYNLAHFTTGSNAADYWRYSGVKAARAFISVSHIEPADDIAPVGDGVSDPTSFAARQTSLRANVAADATLTGTQFINWPLFKQRYSTPDTSSNNLFSIDGAFTALRAQGTEILANISCSPSRFPISTTSIKTEWQDKWEIWQHYYAQAYYLAKTYDVRRYGIMNEPNNWAGVTPESWLLRLRITSDAIQAAISDVNTKYNKNLVAEIFAPNTASGASKYDDYAGGDYWGKLAVDNRHLLLSGISNNKWLNFHIYNYQKYSTLQYDTSTATGYIDDYNLLASKITNSLKNTGEQYAIALTEFNSRTASSYDGKTETSDSPSDYAALGASLVALTRAKQLYLFKFGMTDTTGNAYPVSKNGTHYVDNASTLRSYGGPSSTAEVYRLYNKAAAGERNVYSIGVAPTDVWTLATKDMQSGVTYLFVANKTTGSVTLDFAVSSLGVSNGSAVIVEEVSGNHKGGIRIATTIASGKVPSASLPAQSVWLISILPTSTAPSLIAANANTTVKDGTGKVTPAPGLASLTARSDGTIDGRSMTLLKFVLPNWSSPPKRILLSLQASTISQAKAVQAHIYGLERDDWTEAAATFSNLAPVLKQGVSAGNEIANNVVEDNRANTKFQGQVWVSSTTASERMIDVTDFVRGQTDGTASFLIVQEHRWTKANQLGSGIGDTQSDGIKIISRSTSSKAPRLKVYN